MNNTSELIQLFKDHFTLGDLFQSIYQVPPDDGPARTLDIHPGWQEAATSHDIKTVRGLFHTPEVTDTVAEKATNTESSIGIFRDKPYKTLG